MEVFYYSLYIIKARSPTSNLKNTSGYHLYLYNSKPKIREFLIKIKWQIFLHDQCYLNLFPLCLLKSSTVMK